jgi:hypothetical protein
MAGDRGELCFRFRNMLLAAMIEEASGFRIYRLIRSDVWTLGDDEERAKVAALAQMLMGKTRGIKIYMVGDSVWACYEVFLGGDDADACADAFTGGFGIALPMIAACDEVLKTQMGESG